MTLGFSITSDGFFYLLDYDLYFWHYLKVLEVSTHLIHGKKIDPKRLKQPPTLSSLQKIFVGGIDPQMTESSIREYFGQFGAVSLLTFQLYWLYCNHLRFLYLLALKMPHYLLISVCNWYFFTNKAHRAIFDLY